MAKKNGQVKATVNGNATIRVGVGYGWMKTDDNDSHNGRSVLADIFWQSIRKAFEPKHTAFEKKGVHVNFSRLRASHGRIIWDSVLKRIRDSDILIFDVAAAVEVDEKDQKFDLGKALTVKTETGNVLNANVLIEIGAAIALDKRIMLLCPYEWRSSIPSDLKGYMWTFYNWKGCGKDTERCFTDQYGMQNGYIGMLHEVLEEKLGQTE